MVDHVPTAPQLMSTGADRYVGCGLLNDAPEPALMLVSLTLESNLHPHLYPLFAFDTAIYRGDYLHAKDSLFPQRLRVAT